MKPKPNMALDMEMLAPFYQCDLIVGEPLLVKSGKEATVYRCPAHPDTGLDYVAAKFYRPRQARNFKNDAIYWEGRSADDERTQRAIHSKTRFGREVQFALWIGEEYATLQRLHRAGVSVPRPLSWSDDVLLMEYIGDADAPAPLLNSVPLHPVEARRMFEGLWDDVERMLLDCHRIHGDLSAYNVLVHCGRAVLIDFPQSIDPRHNLNAAVLLHRDIDNLCRFFADYAVHADSDALAANLWRRYERERRYSYR